MMAIDNVLFHFFIEKDEGGLLEKLKKQDIIDIFLS